MGITHHACLWDLLGIQGNQAILTLWSDFTVSQIEL